MKTRIVFRSGLTVFLLLSVFFSQVIKAEETGENVAYVSYSGKTLNSVTGEPIVFASVFIVGTNIGTVSNGDGEFVLKVPPDENKGALGASFIGYKTTNINLNSISSGKVIIKLEPSPIPIKEVIIRSEDPVDLIKQAKKNIPENYSNAPYMVTAFYREIIKQNRSYIGVAEAVLDVYKSSYTSTFDNDRVKIYKGRKSMDVKRMDTLLFKLQGGPRTSFLLDIVKNPGGVISNDFMEFYDYNLDGVIEVEKRQTYVISFDQKDGVEYPLYTGKLYIDAENMAISGIEFRLSEKSIDEAIDEYVRKRPVNLKAEVEGANYLVNYRQINGKWYFSSIKSELVLNCKWDRKLFKSKYTATLEMAVTDMDTENIDRYKFKDATGMSDVFADQVNYFSDDNFWGNYNTIKPEESIEAAISKLNKKIIR